MKILSRLIFCFFILTFFSACRRSVSPYKNPNISIGNYDEDLSALRIKYDAKPATVQAETQVEKQKESVIINQLSQQINSQLDVALDSIAGRNKNIRYAVGYRIQVYVGNDRKDVDEAKIFIYHNFPELNTYLSFSQPTYKLKAGDFTSRLDAERYYSSVKQRYTMAMIIAERIDIKKSMQTK